MTAYMLIKTTLAVGLWRMASTGYLQQKMALWERFLSVGAGALLIVALPLTDEVGFALGLLVVLQHLGRSKQIGTANA
ncbi:transporter membrane protein [Pseudomonas sp. G5(2012)]|nr:transporter membrane protein [Pseudomonas sp. G5(2012)]